jgi:hypothetical protein
MTTRTRIAITVASALALGVTSYGRVWTTGDPGVAPNLWEWGFVTAYGFAIVGVSLVNRWWGLLPAFAPFAVGLYIQLFTDYVSPWREEIVPTATTGYVGYAVVVIGIQAAVLAVGLLLRWFWDAGRRVYVSRRGRAPSPPG